MFGKYVGYNVRESKNAQRNARVIIQVGLNCFIFFFITNFINHWKSPWSSLQCVGLQDVKPGFVSQIRHQNEI